jgi:hypothetical protein
MIPAVPFTVVTPRARSAAPGCRRIWSSQLPRTRFRIGGAIPSLKAPGRRTLRSLRQRELSGAGVLLGTDFYNESCSILAQIFGVTLFPLHVGIEHSGFSDLIDANLQRELLHNTA